MRGTMDLPANILSRCADVHLYLLHNFRKLDLFCSSGTELLDGVINADESEKRKLFSVNARMASFNCLCLCTYDQVYLERNKRKYATITIVKAATMTRNEDRKRTEK